MTEQDSLQKSEMLEIPVVFSDGACSGNPGPGGYGTIVITPDAQVRELGDHIPSTTNNRMEISGSLMGLRALVGRFRRVIVYTDSVYVIRGITQWIHGWRRRGWVNQEGQPVQNQDLWEALYEVVSEFDKIEWRFIRGHKGIEGNERCDEIAVAFSKKQFVHLYSGTLLKYSTSIFPLPEQEPLPEMKTIEPKPKAFSYLSMIGGQVVRHSSWPACEARVKGRSGAKFKKALSSEDESKILKEWGMSSATTIEQDEK